MTTIPINIDDALVLHLSEKGFSIVGYYPPKHGDCWLRTNSLDIGRWNDALGKSELPRLILRCKHCGGSGNAETELYEGIVNCPNCIGNYE